MVLGLAVACAGYRGDVGSEEGGGGRGNVGGIGRTVYDDEGERDNMRMDRMIIPNGVNSFYI